MLTKKDLPRLGLRTGQMRSQRKEFHNGGWYSQDSKKIGFGDLSDKDIKRITEALGENECLIILFEGDSFWNFVENIGTIGSLCTTNANHDQPGVQYIFEFAAGVILPGEYQRKNRRREEWPGDFGTRFAKILGLENRR
jgi:hypothetical protein